MAREILLVEKEGISLNNPVLIEGFPGVGLVASIATGFLVEELKLEEIGYVFSKYLPPAAILHSGKVSMPIRFYGREDLVVVLSEMPIPPPMMAPLAKEILDWCEQREFEMIIALAGISVPFQKGEPMAFGVGTNEESIERLRKVGVKVLEEGVITGMSGLLLTECHIRGLTGIGLLAQARMGYPDPRGAAELIKTLNVLLDLDLSVDPLIEQAKQIEEKMARLMEETHRTMEEGKQSYMMYG